MGHDFIPALPTTTRCPKSRKARAGGSAGSHPSRPFLEQLSLPTCPQSGDAPVGPQGEHSLGRSLLCWRGQRARRNANVPHTKQDDCATELGFCETLRSTRQRIRVTATRSLKYVNKNSLLFLTGNPTV